MSKNDFRPSTSNFIAGLASLALVLISWLISQTLLTDFNASFRNAYGLVWVGVWFGIIGASAARKPVLSVSISAGNLLALVLGNLVGKIDFLIRQTRADPNLPEWQQYNLLHSRHDRFFWFLFVLLFTAIGAALQHKYTVDGYPAWMQKLNVRMKRRIEKIWNAITRLFPG